MITLAQWQSRLAAYLAAETAVLSGQEYEIDAGNGSRRRLKRADLGEIRRGIAECNEAVSRLSSTRGRTRYVVPE